MANTLGRLDPGTGQFKEYVLKTSHTGPHGLTEDKDGNIWFTGNSASLIGKLDPKTGAVTEYRMPNPDAKDPHTLIFDRDGILWFTVQQANMVGRLDPATGTIKLVTSPTSKSRPYGMALNSRTWCSLSISAPTRWQHRAKTMAITEYSFPTRRTTTAHRYQPGRHGLVH